jgi:hypothetical protein
MIKRLAYGLVILGGLGIMAACTSDKKSLGIALQTNDFVSDGTTESVSDKVNVYTAMARAAKYNSDASAQNTLKKLYDGGEDPRKIVADMFVTSKASDKLTQASKAMDFVDLYAMSVLTDNPKSMENILYAKSAQNLSLAAIKLHRKALFADKEIAKLDRLAAQQGKILKGLTDKMERDGDLTEPEINYRKGLEVALNRLAELRGEMVYELSEYTKLIKVSDKGLNLEGKRFYELDDFDKRYTPDIFQDSAVSNRREFVLAKEQLGSFNATKARRQAYVDYPPVARLDINGLAIEDSRYENELFNKARKVSDNALGAVENYRKSPSNDKLKQKAFDALAALVLTEVEVAYRQVEKASFDYDANRYRLSEVKQIIQMMSKKKSLPDYEKVDVLNRQVELLSLEKKEAEILADRAAALRNLYYLAGLSPFNKTMLKGRIAEIERILKQAFNRDLVVMLSAVKDSPKWDDGGNAWAHKDRWLDELIDNPQGRRQSEENIEVAEPVAADDFEASAEDNGLLINMPTKAETSAGTETLASVQAPVFKPEQQSEKVVVAQVPYETENKTMMQLGSYNDMDNAWEDRDEIRNAVPVLKSYDFFIEDAEMNGTVYHRLMIRPEPEKLAELCSEVIRAGYECILR